MSIAIGSQSLAETASKTAFEAFEKFCIPLLENDDQAVRKFLFEYPEESQRQITTILGNPDANGEQEFRHIGLDKFFLATLPGHDDQCSIYAVAIPFDEFQRATLEWLEVHGKGFSSRAQRFELNRNDSTSIFLAKQLEDGGVVQVTIGHFKTGDYIGAYLVGIYLPEPSPAALELFKSAERISE